jgi:hypothetical protein
VTIFDYVVLFILVSSVVISTMRGLVKEILSLVGWVAAFIVANAFGAKLAPMLPSVIPGEALRLIVAFIALFLGVRVLMGLLALAISAPIARASRPINTRTPRNNAMKATISLSDSPGITDGSMGASFAPKAFATTKAATQPTRDRISFTSPRMVLMMTDEIRMNRTM